MRRRTGWKAMLLAGVALAMMGLMPVVLGGCAADGLIGPSGGGITYLFGPLGGAALDVPANALTKTISASIHKHGDITPAGYSSLGPAVEFRPKDVLFSQSATVTLPWDPDKLPGGVSTSSVVGFQRNEQTGVLSQISVSADSNKRQVTVSTTTLGTFQPAYLSGTPEPTPSPTTSPTTSPTVSPTPSATRFMYLANTASNNVTAYSVNGTSGFLTAISGSPYTAGTSPMTAVINPAGPWLYVGNRDAGTISGWLVNSTGVLTSLAGSPYTAPGSPTQLLVDASGSFLFAADSRNHTVIVYSVSALGVLTQVAGSPFAVSGAPTSMALSPTDQYLYVTTNGTPGGVSTFQVNTSSGFLTPTGSSVATGSVPSWIEVSPTGSFAYVANTESNTVSIYSVNAVTGLLTPATGGSSTAVGHQPSSLAFDASGNFVLVTNFGDNTVSVFQVNNVTGQLSAVASSPFATGNGPVHVVVDPGNQLAYVVNQSASTVTVFSFNATSGFLSTVSGSPFPTGSLPSCVVVE